MTKAKNPYLTIINARTAYNAENFKEFKYDEVPVAKGDRGKTSALIEQQTHLSLKDAITEMENCGIEVVLNSAFRDPDDQQYAIDEFYKSELSKNGNNEALARKETDEYCAKIGHSEHQSGLAVDISVNMDNVQVPEKIKERYPDADSRKLNFLTRRLIMEKHGFILTYPQDDRLEEATGMKHAEGWHWRFVGKQHSQMIAKIRERVSQKLDKPYEIFLEDYVELLNKQTYAIDEEQYIEECADLFKTEILKLEKENVKIS